MFALDEHGDPAELALEQMSAGGVGVVNGGLRIFMNLDVDQLGLWSFEWVPIRNVPKHVPSRAYDVATGQ